ncbi:hypothetical protein D4R78_02015 [bacterium]|nr:MAG: hypothetical protein D4R78_02015 [bacterium]
MTERPQKEEILFIFKELEANPTATQRDLFARLSISLGKINYLCMSSSKKGLSKPKISPSNPEN